MEELALCFCVTDCQQHGKGSFEGVANLRAAGCGLRGAGLQVRAAGLQVRAAGLQVAGCRFTGCGLQFVGCTGCGLQVYRMVMSRLLMECGFGVFTGYGLHLNATCIAIMNFYFKNYMVP